MKNGFMMLTKKYSQYKDSKVCIIPVPYEKTTTYLQGTEKGPEAIIKASHELEWFDSELFQVSFKQSGGIFTDELFPVDHKDPEDFISDLRNHIGKMLGDGKFPITLGGEHTIALAPFLACFEKFKDCSVLHIDAHADLRSSYMGTKYNHACVLRMIHQHTTRTVSVGIRSLNNKEFAYIQEEGIPFYFNTDLNRGSLLFQEISDKLGDNVYITLDLDVLDPSVMPAVGTPEPDGLRWRELLKLLKHILKTKNVVGIDIVELKPSPELVYADFTAAKLVYKIIGYKFCS